MRKTSTKKVSKSVKKSKEPMIFIMSGKLTNTRNARDIKSKDQVSFCFKSFDRKRVDYITAPKDIAKSVFFKKGAKINVEVYESPRKINSSNRTLQLVNMWHYN